MTKDKTAQIIKLNDTLRETFTGGLVLITVGIQLLGEENIEQISEIVQAYDDFTSDSDPTGEHRFGIFDFLVWKKFLCIFNYKRKRRVFWTIDYCGLTNKSWSPNPANPAVTQRVLTIMLKSEY